MQVVYATQEPPASWRHAIFLAGPSPRDPQTPSWRPEALQLLRGMGYEGVVFVPEPPDNQWSTSYHDQTSWERMGLEMADKVVFWIPRDLRVMPAFTTNVEFGRYCREGKAVLGFPEGSPKNRYLDWLARVENVPVFHDLSQTLAKAIEGSGEGDVRSSGARYVPKDIFQTPMFQSWYQNLLRVGNRLDKAEVLWDFRLNNKVFSYVLKVDIFVAAEGRHKTNEFVFARTDISATVLHNSEDDEIVLIKEFRSPARTPDGFVTEAPGGSCEDLDNNPQRSAAREVYEECGVAFAEDRFRYVGSHQAVGTLSSHHVHCFAVDASREEMAQLKALADKESFGVDEEERTYVRVMTVSEMLASGEPDWLTYGLVFKALLGRA